MLADDAAHVYIDLLDVLVAWRVQEAVRTVQGEAYLVRASLDRAVRPLAQIHHLLGSSALGAILASNCTLCFTSALYGAMAAPFLSLTPA